MLEWIKANVTALGWLGALSLVMFLAALVLVPWVIVRLPSDYFAPPKRDRSRYHWRRPVLNFPGKYRLERRIVQCRPVLKLINALRARSGRPPLQFAERAR
jgi:hypothetical protein